MTCSYGVPEATLARGGKQQHRCYTPQQEVRSLVKQSCENHAMAHQHTASAPDGTSIAWSRRGSGDPVVLVHGNGNEPEGIVGFLKQVQTPPRSAALASGKSKLVSPLLVSPSVPR